MIIWSGWGILVILFGIIGMVVGVIVGGVVGAVPGGLVGGAAAGGLCMVVARALDKPDIIMDPQTGQQQVHMKSNSFFFIPMRFFTYIFPVVGLCFGLLVLTGQRYDAAMDAKYPGKKLFDAASEKIDLGASGSYHGNTEQAQAIAKIFGESFGGMQSMMFENEDGEAVGVEVNRTYCHKGDENLIFLCYVPDLSTYQGADIQQALTDIAWSSGKLAAENMEGVDENTPMFIGLRGFSSYDFVMKGTVGGECTRCKDDKTHLYTAFDPTTVEAP